MAKQRKVGTKAGLDRKAVIGAWKKSKNMAEVARMLGVSRTAIRHHLRQEGLV